MKILSTLTTISAFACVNAMAAVIVPISATSTGTQNEPGDAGTTLDALINGSGISGTIADDATAGGATHTVGTLTNYWTTTAQGAGDYFANIAPDTLQIDFALDQAYDITRIMFWGYDPGFGAEATENTPTDITVSYSTDGLVFGSPQTINPTIGAGAAQVFAVTGAPSGTTAVRFLINDNGRDDVGAGGDRVGFGEVRFGGTAIPEPSSAMLLGICGLGLALRRRK